MTDAAPALSCSTSTILAEPRFSPQVDQIRDLMATMAPDCPLDAEALHAKAAAETGLADFGPDDYRGAPRRLPGRAARDRRLARPGNRQLPRAAAAVLKNRLLLNDLLARHPEIHDIELLPPVVIAGLPRTGTTHLHNLLAARPDLPHYPVLGKRRAVSAAGRGGCRARSRATHAWMPRSSS